MSITLNASTSSGFVQSADTSGTLELQSNGTTHFNVTSTGAYGQLKSGTSVSTTSGTSVDFTSIPSWVKRITVMFQGLSTNGTSNPMLQIGTSSGIETSGYLGSISTTSFTTGFGITYGTAASSVAHGIAVISLVGNNLWVYSVSMGYSAGASGAGGGSKTLSGTLDRVRLTTVNGTDSFDAGSVNILYEG